MGILKTSAIVGGLALTGIALHMTFGSAAWQSAIPGLDSYLSPKSKTRTARVEMTPQAQPVQIQTASVDVPLPRARPTPPTQVAKQNFTMVSVKATPVAQVEPEVDPWQIYTDVANVAKKLQRIDPNGAEWYRDIARIRNGDKTMSPRKMECALDKLATDMSHSPYFQSHISRNDQATVRFIASSLNC